MSIKFSYKIFFIEFLDTFISVKYNEFKRIFVGAGAFFLKKYAGKTFCGQ
jgi:hypothetical protein